MMTQLIQPKQTLIHMQIVPPPLQRRDKSATASRRCKAVYSYTQNNQDELTLAVGDVIEFLDEVSVKVPQTSVAIATNTLSKICVCVLCFVQVEEGWWRGRLAGKTGVFPSNFVVMETQSPALAANRNSHQNNTTPSINAAAAASTNITTTNTTQILSSSISSNSSGNNNNAATAAAVAYAAAAVAKQMSSSRENLECADATTVSVAAISDAPVLPPKPGEYDMGDRRRCLRSVASVWLF